MDQDGRFYDTPFTGENAPSTGATGVVNAHDPSERGVTQVDGA